MSIIFSKKCEYGIQAILFLSSLPLGTTTNAEEIAKELPIPKEFVSKILQELTPSGIIASKKGKNGGFILKRLPSELKLIDIVKAIDGDGIFSQCVLGFPNCSNETPCPVHATWSKINNETYAMLSKETIDSFLLLTKKKITSIRHD
jgi:Rrf2 family protein